MKRLMIVVLLCCAFGSTAEARHHHYKHYYVTHSSKHVYKTVHWRSHYRHRHSRLADSAYQRGSKSRPRAWCGWYARLHLAPFDPGISFNLARNWASWGRPTSPGIGVMVVWVHHVGMIVGRTSDGQWIVRSGNDGHAVKTRPRSIAGAIAFRAA